MRPSCPKQFDEAAFQQAIRLAGPWFDPHGPAGRYRLNGRFVDASMPTGIYIGVGGRSTPLYAGKVRRRDGGVAERLRAHNQPVELWEEVWLIPLIDETPDDIVRMLELALIRKHMPTNNIVGREQ